MNEYRPYEPSGDMRQVAGALWDMYQAYIQAGFNEWQALDLVKTGLEAGIRNNNNEGNK